MHLLRCATENFGKTGSGHGCCEAHLAPASRGPPDVRAATRAAAEDRLNVTLSTLRAENHDGEGALGVRHCIWPRNSSRTTGEKVTAAAIVECGLPSGVDSIEEQFHSHVADQAAEIAGADGRTGTWCHGPLDGRSPSEFDVALRMTCSFSDPVRPGNGLTSFSGRWRRRQSSAPYYNRMASADLA